MDNEAGLHLFTSNRLETLAAKLSERLRRPLLSPLQPEIIVVRNQGMERWLKLELARYHGICANTRFRFPEAFAYEMFRTVLPAMADDPPFEREVMLWKIMKTLPGLLSRREFGSLEQYLSRRSDPRKLVQLASRIAHLFDQYLIFRPEMVLAWEEGRDEHWQAILWRSLARETNGRHPAALRRDFAAALAQPNVERSGLPERVSIFGLSALPPFYLEVFTGLAARVEVSLFLLQPSQEYWGEITSGREEERLLRHHGQRADQAFALHLETGNRLLASLGYLGRDFLKLVLDAGDWVTEDACESFTEPGTDTLLHTVQSDILHLRDRGRDHDCPPLELRPGDDSIQVHCCHSPLREMEVLHDHLLDWFRRDPQLSPHEILVMMPDIEAYAPFIQAVFDSPEDESRRIPFSLADRSARRQSQVIDTFLTLLNLPLTRLGSATVLTLLEAPVVRQRFHLIEQELERIRSWIEETRICWGIDQQHRAQFELPELPNHTWRAGLDRLLLGYALPGRGQHLFAGTLPCDDIEGNAATVLGRFVEFAEQLFATVESLRMARPFGQWQKLLQEVLRRFFHANPQTEPELVEVHAAIDQLARQAALADFQEPLDFAVVLERLTPALESDRFASGFLTGGVTFCALKPMRSIPFKIICLVGMNDEAFPRPTSHLSFDLMARQPRLGDRSSREDDRYLFLETLLSARQRLYLSYVGQSIRDNSQTPPSVLVSELAQYVAQAFTLAPAAPAAGSAGVPLGGSARTPEAKELAGRDASASIVTRHRLQAFSEAYFGGEQPGLFSYSEENCAASQLARRGRAKPRPFLDQPLAEAESEWRHVDLEQLAEFLCNPSKFLITRRLGLQVPGRREALEEREPFVLEDLEAYTLKQDLLELKLAGHDLPSALAQFQASGRLPIGRVGEAYFQSLCTETGNFFERLRAYSPTALLPPEDLDVRLGAFHLTGRLTGISRSGLLQYRCATVKARDILRFWVRHLAWHLLRPGGQVPDSVLVGEDRTLRYRALAEPELALRGLLDLYWHGLSQPLPFFPQTSRAFAEAERNAREHRKKDPLVQAQLEWSGSRFNNKPGERDNVFFDLCFRNSPDPLGEAFQHTARTIFQPVLEHEQEEPA